MPEVFNIEFVTVLGKKLGKKTLTMQGLEKLQRGMIVSFEGHEGLYKLYSFAVNSGHPEGHIVFEELIPDVVFNLVE